MNACGFPTDSQDEDSESILARVQEESRRYYEEVELPRLNGSSRPNLGLSSDAVPSTSKQFDLNKSNVLCSQVGGKAGAFLYEGEEAKGFHIDSGKTYIYPTNYPVRAYQANMVKAALFANTLISLPTGLGKTFIAAVVMYNFYRWYPFGKIVFMAPTRPLVAQQIKACYDVMGIPKDDTTEMTGVQSAACRKALWKEKRVFFLTPQVLANDVRSKICPSELVKCLVVDEAHKAVKEYAYCQVVKQLLEVNPYFRILALSATPGKDINTVQQVIRNLNIARLEIRGEDSIDVHQYTFSKLIESIAVEASKEMIQVKRDFLEVYDKYARRLKELHALPSNISFLSKFQVLKAMEKFRTQPPSGLPPTVIGSLVGDFSVCMTMAHALDLLQLYGLRALYNYFAEDGSDKNKVVGTRLKNDQDLRKLLENLKNALYPPPELNLPYVWGHPKLQKLVTLLDQHFKSGELTKAIVFCEYRVVVMEIVKLLNNGERRYKAAEFIGQSGGKEKGMPQSKQIQTMQEFREGKIQVLVATCVAEEGLDIGEVDLIVLMETKSSPVRFVQRLGRTGRKRKGKCVVLLSEGREERKFIEAMASRKSYVEMITKSNAVKTALNHCTPSMFPPGVKPMKECIHIKVDNSVPEKVAKQPLKKQMDVREFLTAVENPHLSVEDLQKVKSQLGKNRLEFTEIPKRTEMWHRCYGQKMSMDELLDKNTSRLSHWNDWFAEDQKTFGITHSCLTSNLRHLLNFKPKLSNSPERLKLLKAAVTESPARADCAKRRLSTSPVKLPEENPAKKTRRRKETAKNSGMDIRECIAKARARDKQTSQKTHRMIEEVVLIHDEITPPARFTEVANIFNLKPDDFEILLVNEFVSEFDEKNDMVSRLNKYALGRKTIGWKPLKPVNFNFDLANLEEISLTDGGVEDVISTVNRSSKGLISPATDLRTNDIPSDGLRAQEGIYPKNRRIEETFPLPNCVSSRKDDHIDFASFDDLFEDDLILPDDISNIETAHRELVDETDENPVLEPVELPLLGSSGRKDLPFKRISTPPSPAVREITGNLHSSKITDVSTSLGFPGSSSDRMQFNDAVASTPIVPRNKPDGSPDAPWNVSDLFEDEEEKEENKQEEGETDQLLMDITQMINEIENNKKTLQKDVTNSTDAGSSKSDVLSEQKSSNFKAFKPKQRVYSGDKPGNLGETQLEKAIKISSISKRKLTFEQASLNESDLGSNKRKSSQFEDNDDDDILPLVSSRKRPPKMPCKVPIPSNTKNKTKMRTKPDDGYVDREADVTGALSEDDSDNSSLDQLDESFINDESVPNVSVGNYLKSVRSPVIGKFKIKTNSNMHNCVYSQRLDDDYLGEYENDSFCVESEGESLISSPSILDEVEKALERRKRAKTPASTSSSQHSVTPNDVIQVNKRKRRRVIHSDSDDEHGQSPNKPNDCSLRENEPDEVIVISSGESADGAKDMRESQKHYQMDLQEALYRSQVEVQRPSYSNLNISYQAASQPSPVALRKLQKLNKKYKKILGSISRTNHDA